MGAVHELQLRHYSAEPELFLDREHEYPEQGARLDKPAGFWVSVLGEDDWKSWCESEEFRVDTLTNEHTVTLTERANVLLLDSPTALMQFTRAWKIEAYGSVRGIRWNLLAGHYDGIIIAPYQWALRMAPETSWYYGWDCASGCIWNLDAIAAVEPNTREELREAALL